MELGKDIRIGAGSANTIDALEVPEYKHQKRGGEHE